MQKQPPLIQAIAWALLAVIVFSAIHFASGTRAGDPLVYAFIAIVALTGFILTLVRAQATLHPEKYEGQGKFLQSYPFLALTFVLLAVFGYVFNVLFIREPGDSMNGGLAPGLAIGATIVVLNWRRSRRIADSFWKMLAITGSIAVASAVVRWAMVKLV